jgi:hypothetical protein
MNLALLALGVSLGACGDIGGAIGDMNSSLVDGSRNTTLEWHRFCNAAVILLDATGFPYPTALKSSPTLRRKCTSAAARSPAASTRRQRWPRPHEGPMPGMRGSRQHKRPPHGSRYVDRQICAGPRTFP